jgi:quinol monooxygenase YgiN
VPVDNDDHVLVTATWTSPEHYAGWLENPIREAMRSELEPLLADEPEPLVYHVVATVS